MSAEPSNAARRTKLIYRFAYFGLLPGIAAILILDILSPPEWRQTLVMVALLMTLLCLHISVVATRKFKSQEKERLSSEEQIRVSKMQMEELFAMTDMLQSADCHDHAGAVLEATASGLLPRFGGALYVFNNSRDRLDLIRSWNARDDFKPTETLLPGSCWAIKRGKPHINENEVGSLTCFHHLCDAPAIEIPMMARGSLYGLLVLSVGGENAVERLNGIHKIARALADSMSLALSNISLNEKLKTQSMRDPLTGLYNRRYMEDALERAVASASRNGDSTSVVMIDLDNFKRLNDEHGHAKGDAVLRDVAAHLVGTLRPADTVSRYGGEELLIIMPSTELHDAATKAESLRVGVERLSQAHDLPISASFGVSALPACVDDHKELIAAADTALYQAKQDGKNCVRSAEQVRPKPDEPDAELEQEDFLPKLVAN